MSSRIAVVVALISWSAHAQNISGTFDGAFTSFDTNGVPSVHMSLGLQCSLTCTSSAPDLHFGYSSSVVAMVAAPSLSAALTLKTVDSTGAAAWDTSAPAGSNFTATVKGVTCYCGGMTGQGGSIDLTTPAIHVPPFVNVLAHPVTTGQNPLLIVYAAPVGTETVDVHVTGAGVDYSHSYTATDFMTATSGNVSTQSHSVDVTFTAAGMATVTASVGGGPVTTQMITVVGAGSGGGGGTSSTGGGSNAGGGSDTGGSAGGAAPGGGCTAAPGLLPLAALLLLRRRYT